MIYIFLISQSFIRLLSHDHHGLCYHVLKIDFKESQKRPFLHCFLPAEISYKTLPHGFLYPHVVKNTRFGFFKNTISFKYLNLTDVHYFLEFGINTGKAEGVGR